MGDPAAGPDPDQVARLRRALAAAERGADGSGIVDLDRERAKAPLRARALRLLDQRARATEELRRRLAEDDDAPAELIAEVLADLRSAGLLDDAAFAAEWVRQRARRRGKSRRVLDRELRDKGVSAADRDAALDQVGDAEEEATAAAVAAKRTAAIRRVPADRAERDRDLRRVLGALARRGFPQEVAMRRARAALAERYAELDGGGPG
ncbi:recombinase RecX [Corynebacterium sphenisci DSM 44792]|uniref:Regulatory protein RecX n=1 Tax=Corynebacterium sphenisci DSM 44792 TaxID=1437874 RepID=A0A1L7CXL3_9CORY|nr:regulatory protein RecX [Corynebacterium sphenisci]APT90604.1 recombinase RecX [Corynebacterium sphenisci DSM 44792]